MQKTIQFQTIEDMTKYINRNIEFIRAIDNDNKTVVIWSYDKKL